MYRFETQQRGSFHDHGLYTVDGAPNVYQNTKQDICNFVDKYITCSIDHLLIKYQMHNCTTKTCFKKRNAKNCRFDFPCFPIKTTVVLQPLSTIDYKKSQIDFYKKGALKIKEYLKLNTFDTDMTIENVFD